MTAHQARRGGGPDPTGPQRRGGPRAGAPGGAPPATGPVPGTAGTTRAAAPGPAAAETDREWDPFTRLLLLLEVSGRRSWLEGLTSPDRT
ncbi:hypothetical protein KBZ10_20715 [Streptomyces sp. F63]|uniref:hypothetical protein n=1 Tax=Streptomyces sp. F63 TaxID=2824887 RepID=UPI001B36A6AA|nr:hypothetical protein [Streptomyces sp. F63]MBQ0986891.1 hypothetical protein [Streptomyces sp. F63]